MQSMDFVARGKWNRSAKLFSLPFHVENVKQPFKVISFYTPGQIKDVNAGHITLVLSWPHTHQIIFCLSISPTKRLMA